MTRARRLRSRRTPLRGWNPTSAPSADRSQLPHASDDSLETKGIHTATTDARSRPAGHRHPTGHSARLPGCRFSVVRDAIVHFLRLYYTQ